MCDMTGLLSRLCNSEKLSREIPRLEALIRTESGDNLWGIACPSSGGLAESPQFAYLRLESQESRSTSLGVVQERLRVTAALNFHTGLLNPHRCNRTLST